MNVDGQALHILGQQVGAHRSQDLAVGPPQTGEHVEHQFPITRGADGDIHQGLGARRQLTDELGNPTGQAGVDRPDDPVARRHLHPGRQQLRGGGDEVEIGGQPGEQTVRHSHAVGAPHPVEGPRQRDHPSGRVQEMGSYPVEQAPARGRRRQQPGGPHLPGRPGMGQRIGEGAHEDQGDALGPGGDELAGGHPDHHRPRTQTADQCPLGVDPRSEHSPGEGVAHGAALVEGEGEHALVIAQAPGGGEKMEIEARRRAADPGCVGTVLAEQSRRRVSILDHFLGRCETTVLSS